MDMHKTINLFWSLFSWLGLMSTVSYHIVYIWSCRFVRKIKLGLEITLPFMTVFRVSRIMIYRSLLSLSVYEKTWSSAPSWGPPWQDICRNLEGRARRTADARDWDSRGSKGCLSLRFLSIAIVCESVSVTLAVLAPQRGLSREREPRDMITSSGLLGRLLMAPKSWYVNSRSLLAADSCLNPSWQFPC